MDQTTNFGSDLTSSMNERTISTYRHTFKKHVPTQKVKNMIITLKNASKYIIDVNVDKYLQDLIEKRFNEESDRQIARLRNASIKTVMNHNDKLIARCCGSDEHAKSLMFLKRQFDDIVTFENVDNGYFTFKLNCNEKEWYLESRTYNPVDNLPTPFDNFIEQDVNSQIDYFPLYVAYVNQCDTEPMSQISFNRHIKAYFPNVVSKRGNDVKRTFAFVGIKLRKTPPPPPPPLAPPIRILRDEVKS